VDLTHKVFLEINRKRVNNVKNIYITHYETCLRYLW